jgi:uncharacterized protein (TIGR03067 family)
MILVVGLFLAADTPKDDAAKKELEKFQGTWKVTTIDQDGKASIDDFKDSQFIFKGDKYTFKTADLTEEGTIKLDPAQKPPTIDLMITAGDCKGKTQLGIYKIEGDSLTACFAQPDDKERPKELASKAGSKHIYVVCKREKS